MYDDNDKYSDVKYNIKFSTMRKTWIELGINVFSSNFMNNLSKVIFFQNVAILRHISFRKKNILHTFLYFCSNSSAVYGFTYLLIYCKQW